MSVAIAAVLVTFVLCVALVAPDNRRRLALADFVKRNMKRDGVLLPMRTPESSEVYASAAYAMARRETLEVRCGTSLRAR